MASTCSGGRHPHPKLLAALLPALLLAAGCPPNPSIGFPGFPAPAPKLSVSQLARELGMTVKECSPREAELRSGPHNVSIFADEHNGRVYVNGRPLETAGDVLPGDPARPGSQPQLSAEWVKAIRKHLPYRPPVGGLAPPIIHPPTEPPKPVILPPIGTVVVDPGHGGHQPGAVSVYRDEEKVIVLGVASTLAARLQAANVRVTLTRNSDKTVSLDDRVAVGNRIMPDLFVSVHADAANSSRADVASGYTVLVPRRASRPSQAAAEAIHARLARIFPGGRGVRTDPRNVHVLRDTRCPAVLVELGFLTNSYDASLLADRKFRDKLADAITQGIVDYLHTLKPPKPR